MKLWAKLGACPCLCSRELQNHKFFIVKKLKSCFIMATLPLGLLDFVDF